MVVKSGLCLLSLFYLCFWRGFFQLIAAFPMSKILWFRFAATVKDFSMVCCLETFFLNLIKLFSPDTCYSATIVSRLRLTRVKLFSSPNDICSFKAISSAMSDSTKSWVDSNYLPLPLSFAIWFKLAIAFSLWLVNRSHLGDSGSTKPIANATKERQNMKKLTTNQSGLWK